MSEMKCPKCGEMCAGEDLGDHPGWLDYYCPKCKEVWGASDHDRLASMADHLRMQHKEVLL